MSKKLYSAFIVVMVTLCMHVFSFEENFILICNKTDATIVQLGPHIEERVTPCSTFKIALSLMGYDAGILKDKKTPIWEYKKGYSDYLESWKTFQSPQSWIQNSCVWYSKLLTLQIGLEDMQKYLNLFEYGNRDLTGGIGTAWLSSSLKISPQEQVSFIKKMIQENLAISKNAITRTKSLFYIEELSDEWKLFGKTGFGHITEQDNKSLEIGWVVGWIEKDNSFFSFAYNIRDDKIDILQRLPRVKDLIFQSGILSK